MLSRSFSGSDPIRTLAVGRGTVCKGLVDPMGLVKWPSYPRAMFALRECDLRRSNARESVSSREPDVASLGDREFRRTGGKSDGSAGETLSEPYWLCLTCCRCVDGLGLLRSARSGSSDACGPGTGSARHQRGTKGNRAVLVPVVLREQSVQVGVSSAGILPQGKPQT